MSSFFIQSKEHFAPGRYDAARAARVSPTITVALFGERGDRPRADDVELWRSQCETADAGLVLPEPGLPRRRLSLARRLADSRESGGPQMSATRPTSIEGDLVLFASRPPRDGELAALRARLSRRPHAPRTPGLLSVVVPVHNGVSFLDRALSALQATALPRDRWELVIVDDVSTDDSARVAAQYADLLLRLRAARPFGPAYARNRGFEAASGEYVIFVDADVCVHADTLGSFLHAFESDETISAVVGSYDDRPSEQGLVSQHRNLLHHFYHQHGVGDVVAFWGGCGAVRSSSFDRAGMYDEWHFIRPQVEDIELGVRLRSAQCRTVLRPEIQGTHLKRWTLSEVVATDLRDRGAAWTRVVNQRLAADPRVMLTLRAAERRKTVLACLTMLALLAPSVLPRGAGWPLLLLCLGAFTLSNRDQYAFFRRARGTAFAIATVPLDLLYYVVNGLAMFAGWILRATIGEPRPDPVTEAMSEVGADVWPPVRRRRSGARSAVHASDLQPREERTVC